MKPADVTETLKPCPFCGNDGSGPIEDALHISFHEAEWRHGDAWSVQCDKCTATMGYSKTKDEAIESWNTRATPVVKQSLTADVTEADRVAVTVIDLAAHDIHRREQIMANHRIAAFEAGRVAGLEWQPIETAPKDGQQFLVWDGRDFDLARWHLDHVCGESLGHYIFTHWQPLPAPPQETANDPA